MAKIMIVDDSPSSARALARLLACDGHRVLSYQFPEHALYQYCEVHPVDVVLSDIQMPGLSGPELFEGLNKILQPHERPLYVGMTGHASRDDISRMLAAGARSVLLKPFLPQEFYAATGLCVESRSACKREPELASSSASSIIYRPTN